MTGLAAAIVAIFASWNPFSTPRLTVTSRQDQVFGATIGAGIVALVAAGTDPILSALSVSVPTLRTAAGAVIALFGARWAIGPAPTPVAPDDNPTLLTAIAVVTPSTVLAAMAITGEDGWLTTVIGIALTLAASIALDRAGLSERLAGMLRRATGGIAVAVGVALIFAGIRSV